MSNIEMYQDLARMGYGKDDDVAVLLLVIAFETGPDIHKILKFTGFDEELIRSVLWRATVFELFTDIKWQDDDLAFHCAVEIAKGAMERQRTSPDQEWLYTAYPVTPKSEFTDNPTPDGRYVTQSEATALQNQHRLTRSEAWAKRRRQRINIKQITFDCNRKPSNGRSKESSAKTTNST